MTAADKARVAERQRIRRAQQWALANLKLLIPESSAYYEDILAIDRATRAPKGKRK